MASICKENVRQPVARSSSPEPAAKKIKITPEKGASFRSWVADEKSPGPVYVLKCEYGDPSKPLSSHVKALKKADLVLEVKRCGLSTDGSRGVLLDRLQNELPYVRLEMDGRECIQRVISSFLNHFGWDNSHLFTAEIPRRGDSDVEALSRAVQDPKALADFRKMNGSAFDPMAEAFDYEMGEEEPPQCNVSMQELFLQKGDVLKFAYDMGGRRKFTVTIEDVKPEGVLPGETAYGQPTRVRRVGKGKARIPKQY